MHACHAIVESFSRIRNLERGGRICTDEIDELVLTNAAPGDDKNTRQDHRKISRSSHAQRGKKKCTEFPKETINLDY